MATIINPNDYRYITEIDFNWQRRFNSTHNHNYYYNEITHTLIYEEHIDDNEYCYWKYYVDNNIIKQMFIGWIYNTYGIFDVRYDGELTDNAEIVFD